MSNIVNLNRHFKLRMKKILRSRKYMLSEIIKQLQLTFLKKNEKTT